MSNPDTLRALRADLWANGFRPVALCNHDSDSTRSPGKRPLGFGWAARARRNPPESSVSASVRHGQNTGILCDGLRALDIDFDDSLVSSDLTLLSFRLLGETIIRTRRSGGKLLLLYRAAEGEPRKRALTAESGKVEVLGYGQQFAAFGTHFTGVPLEWPDGSPAMVHRDALPAVTEEQITAYLDAARAIVGPSAAVTATEDTRSSGYGFTADLQDIASAMSALPNDGPADWASWNRVGMALWAATEGSGEGFDLFNAYSEQHPDYNPAAVEERWTIYPQSPPDRIGAGSLFYLARQADPAWHRPSAVPSFGTEFDALPPRPVDAIPSPIALLEITEDAAALEFASRHAGRFVYDHTDATWFKFTDEVGWAIDDRSFVTTATRDFVRSAREHWTYERSTAVAKISFVNNVVSACRSDTRMARCHADWNTEPMLLGIPGGHLDLRDGTVHRASEAVLMRRRTSVAPSPRTSVAPSPWLAGRSPSDSSDSSDPYPAVWLSFLGDATGHDPALMAWLQRFCGYALTGDVSEEMMAFVYGPGGNGKGVFLHTLSAIMGDYAYQAPSDLFKADSKTNREYQLANLSGIRLLLTSETEQGSTLAESFVKELTGNEGKINARQPFGRAFQFKSQAKLLIVGNHAPALHGRTDAMERRLKVVPFNRRPETPDPDLKDKLVAEYPAILRWMVDGCLMWQRERLGMCDAVRVASGSYFNEQDILGQWIADRCTVAAVAPGSVGAAALHTVPTSLHTGAAALLDDFNAWLRDRGDKHINAKSFKESILRVQGVSEHRTSRGAGYSGIVLRDVSSESEFPPISETGTGIPAGLLA